MVVDIPDVVTYANFGDHRLRGFGGRGSNFPLSHRLSSSPLQHSRTIVRACAESIDGASKGKVHWLILVASVKTGYAVCRNLVPVIVKGFLLLTELSLTQDQLNLAGLNAGRSLLPGGRYNTVSRYGM